MTYQYVASRHHALCAQACETLGDAIQAAALDWEVGEAWPWKIVAPDGQVLWEQSGPLTTGATLRRFADEHGAGWPVV